MPDINLMLRGGDLGDHITSFAGVFKDYLR